ncbi:alpha-aspartyl dipeptidase isoform X1 [Bacillus rossius redtenbacheri]
MGLSNRNLLLISSSMVHGYGYLDHAADELKAILHSAVAKRVLFVPYALRDHEGYAEKVRAPLKQLGFEVESIHNASDPVAAVKDAEAIFIGGGNTFRLLKTLYDMELIEPIHCRALQDGVPYIGSSAGTNVATVNICTTNDMPIIYPPSFAALNLVPFNINPHYVDPDVKSTHKGETREERLRQYHEEPGTPPVLGLREGAMLRVQGDRAEIRGVASARLFRPNKDAEEYTPGSDVSFLLN